MVAAARPGPWQNADPLSCRVSAPSRNGSLTASGSDSISTSKRGRPWPLERSPSSDGCRERSGSARDRPCFPRFPGDGYEWSGAFAAGRSIDGRRKMASSRWVGGAVPDEDDVVLFDNWPRRSLPPARCVRHRASRCSGPAMTIASRGKGSVGPSSQTVPSRDGPRGGGSRHPALPADLRQSRKATSSAAAE